MNLTIRPFRPDEFDAWLPLWTGYQTFYKRSLPIEVAKLAWSRFHDPNVPMHALGAFENEKLLGITHYIFHFSCLTEGPSCYLQDLFTVAGARGKGVGRLLIDAAYAAAKKENAGRFYWTTHETNAEAQVLYNKVAERSGFIVYRKPI